MLKSIAILLSFLTIVQHCICNASAEECIGSFKALQALQVARSNNTAIPVTYVICPNTVFSFKKQQIWALNGNAAYLCGANGSSTNKCVVTGGDFQFDITYFPYNSSNKDNILLSGFSFETAGISNAAIAYPGRNLTIRDCIFKDNNNHGVLALVLYIPPEPVPRPNRRLGSSSKMEPDEFDYKNDLINFMKDPELRQQRMDDRNARSLLIGGGSEPRLTLLLDRVKFLNNSLASSLSIPSLAQNGPIDVYTAFADLTVSQCLFKDNNFPYSQQLYTGGFGIKVDPSSTLNISDSCFVNDYYSDKSPLWIRADSGLVSSMNNFVSETDAPGSPCEYMFKEEAYKCFAPESNVCNLLDCTASYILYNARTDKVVTTIVNGGTIASPPCQFNIEAILPCGSSGKILSTELFFQNGTVAVARNGTMPYFLYGKKKDNILPGSIASGTYKIQAVSNGKVLPSPHTFTFSGKCVH